MLHTCLHPHPGHTYFLEDGVEQGNYITGNLGLLTYPSYALLNTDTTPAVFWITNPNNVVKNNVGSGGGHVTTNLDPPGEHPEVVWYLMAIPLCKCFAKCTPLNKHGMRSGLHQHTSWLHLECVASRMCGTLCTRAWCVRPAILLLTLEHFATKLGTDGSTHSLHTPGSTGGYGFWYRFLTHPEGPSFTTSVCPKFTPLWEFKDNVAHSNMFYGLR